MRRNCQPRIGPFRGPQSGGTLIESLFAVFLVATAAAIVAITMPIANTARAKADLQNKATMLAMKELEAIRTRGYANATATQLFSMGLIDTTVPTEPNTYPFTQIDASRFDSPARLLPNGEGFVRIEQTDLDLKSVTIWVRWTEKGRQQSVTMGTLIANL